MKNNEIGEPKDEKIEDIEKRDEEIEDIEEDIIEEIEDIEEVIEDIREDIEILQKNDKYIFLMLIGMFAVLLILGIAILTNSPAVQTEPQAQPEPAGVSGTPSSLLMNNWLLEHNPMITSRILLILC